jgi:hypothetical protein
MIQAILELPESRQGKYEEKRKKEEEKRSAQEGFIYFWGE